MIPSYPIFHPPAPGLAALSGVWKEIELASEIAGQLKTCLHHAAGYLPAVHPPNPLKGAI